jgi:hypothetical protein
MRCDMRAQLEMKEADLSGWQVAGVVAGWAMLCIGTINPSGQLSHPSLDYHDKAMSSSYDLSYCLD